MDSDERAKNLGSSAVRASAIKATSDHLSYGNTWQWFEIKIHELR